MHVRIPRASSLAVLCALLGACIQNQPPPTPPKSSMDSWLYRTQGLVGVFPPREDVRVGDVHLYLHDPDGQGVHTVLDQAPRWSYLPSSASLNTEQRRRPEYPATPSEYLRTGVAPTERQWPEATSVPGFLEPGSSVDRLRSIELPPFAHYRTKEGEQPPNWGMHDFLEEAFDDWQVVRIHVESAEGTNLPLETAISDFLERRATSFYLPASLRQNLRALAPDSLRTVWVRMVTQVIYMRAMRVTVVADSSGFEELDEDVSRAELGDEEVETEAATEDLDPVYASLARANAMNREMIESGTDVLPDSFVRYVSVSEESTSARRVYRRPIAIGVGGLSLRVDARTGEVEELRLMGRNLTSRAPATTGTETGRALDAKPRLEVPDPDAAPQTESDSAPQDGAAASTDPE